MLVNGRFYHHAGVDSEGTGVGVGVGEVGNGTGIGVKDNCGEVSVVKALVKQAIFVIGMHCR
jgi:hypothetical protein